MLRHLALILAAGACGGGAARPDGGDATPNACDATCLEQRWWINVASSCAVLCMSNPGLAECGHADCKQISAQRYRSGTLRTLAPVLWSQDNRSFYALATPTSDGYSVMPGCQLQIASRPPQSFGCSGDTLTFSVGSFRAATTAETTALEAADTAGAPGRYSY